MALIISTTLAGYGAGQREVLMASALSPLELVSALASHCPRAALMRAEGCGR